MTRRLPDQEESIAREEVFDFAHEGPLLVRLKMMKRLANPDHVERTPPVVHGLDEALATQFDCTSESGEFGRCDIKRRLGYVDADVSSDRRPRQRFGRTHRCAAAKVSKDKAGLGFIQEQLVEQTVHLAVRHIVRRYHFLIGRQSPCKQFLICGHDRLQG